MSVEWWVVFVTLAGPILAVQTQKIIERTTDRKNRRQRLFIALMANRATRLNEDFVRALNLIDIEFLPGLFFRSRDQAVINTWHELLGIYNTAPPVGADVALQAAWSQRVEDKLVELLAAMAKAVGYSSLTSEQLRRGIYHPLGAFERDQSIGVILDGLGKAFKGQASIPMAIKELPTTPEFAKAQVDFIKKAASAYDEKSGALRIKEIK
ncbi:DUF6680 family protein [Bradyrhizobium sp.]|jgi:hypothetical protein|uniref:DUF6680 family protein n=1 Tax=Bradyrhizobium sp. TaxID=376 RepID=UPI002DDD3FF4|nr:DUF6680 family protein [Bradyrhizobium sp.]HEV2159563.1 DUF6680 family protein [Bradyrhizobium sp.]